MSYSFINEIERLYSIVDGRVGIFDDPDNDEVVILSSESGLVVGGVPKELLNHKKLSKYLNDMPRGKKFIGNLNDL